VRGSVGVGSLAVLHDMPFSWTDIPFHLFPLHATSLVLGSLIDVSSAGTTTVDGARFWIAIPT
jgi:hypothetical protein